MSLSSDASALSFVQSVTPDEARSRPSAPMPSRPGPSDRSPRLYDALSPLVTDIGGPGGDVDREETANPLDSDPFQALVADIAIQRSREDATPRGPRSALLRAVAELAETHAVAADLACEKTAIDLPLEVPDPTPAPTDATTMLIVPDVIRACRDRLATRASSGDRRRIDIVATLFDHVLSDDRIPTAVRNTLARLQLPVLRMALADESFFKSTSHPTRRLIDRLAASAAKWQADTPGGRAGFAALERIVHTVIRGSFEDAREHARLLDQFERQVADIASAHAPRPRAHDAEDRDVLVITTTIQISQLLAGIEVDRAIRVFLLDVWTRVLVEIACGDDAGRDALLARAKRLCFDLAWTAAPKTTSGERARLAGVLPTMIAAIRDGLRMIDYPEADERAFFNDWTRVLLQAVRSAPGVPFRRADSGEGLTIDIFAQRLRTGSFGPEPAADTVAPGAIEVAAPGLRPAEEVAPTTRQDVAAAPTVLATAPAPAPAPVVVEEMKKGDWFEMRASDKADDFVRVRLSWVSPLRSFYLLIGADNALTRSLDPAAIRALVECGDLRRAKGRRDD